MTELITAQDVSMGLLGLCYLTTSPDQSESVTMFRLMTMTSMVEAVTRYLTHVSPASPRSHGEQVELVTGLCSIVKSVVVFSMAVRIVNNVLRYENLL